MHHAGDISQKINKSIRFKDC